jgi:hypothetical protein
MVVLELNFFNYVSIFFVLIAFVIVFCVAGRYFVDARRNSQTQRRNRSLTHALLKSHKLRDKKYYERQKQHYSQREITLFVIDFIEGSPREYNLQFQRFFCDEGVEDGLIHLLRRGKVQQRIMAANALSYLPSDKTFNALKSALSGSNQDICIAAALALVFCNRHISLTDLIIKLNYLIPQKSLFCLFRLLPSDVLKTFEDVVRRLQCENQAHQEILYILQQLSSHYIAPHFECVKNDRRRYIHSVALVLLRLQSTPADIVRSCYLMNFINETCLQNKVYQLEVLIDDYFDFDSATFQPLDRLSPQQISRLTGRG